MARIGYEDGAYVGLGTYEERTLWKQYGFVWKPLRKRWVAPTLAIAKKVPNVYWMEDACEAAAQEMETAALSYDMSFKASTDFHVPLSDAVKAKGWDFKPFQKAGIEYASLRSDTLIADQPGLGKAQPLVAPVLTPTGWVKIGDLQVGDVICHPSGAEQTVIGVHDRGVMPMYRVTFSDGSSTVCGADHLWTFKRPQYVSRVSKAKVFPEWETRELQDIVERTSGYATLRSAKFRIPLTEPIDFPAKTLPLDPYLLGVLLGDGSFRAHAVTFSSVDDDLVRFVRDALPSGVRVTFTGHGCDYRIAAAGGNAPNAVMDALRAMDLMGKHGDDKTIPLDFMLAPLADRIKLLQGLLDTDGYVSKDGTVQFSSNSLGLVHGVRHLVQSMGGVARLKKKISASGKSHWITTLNIPAGIIPFRIVRKAIRYRPKAKYPPTRMFTQIERIDDQPCRCIKVSAPDGLYITDEFIVTHNTIQAIGCQNVDPGLRKTLVVVPASLKENWRREWLLWGSNDYTVGIAETQRKTKVRDGFYKNGKPKWKTVVEPTFFPMTDVVIINYDILDRFPEIWEMQWDYLVCDECHALKSEESKRTLMVLGGHKRGKKGDGTGGKGTWFKAIEANVRVFLSGTPMLNRPIEMWPMCKAFDAGDLGRKRDTYAYRYCAAHTTSHGLDVSGCSNAEELQELLRKKFMVRRLKKEVLPELPDKTRVIVTLDSPEIREVVARESELAEALGLFEQMVAKSSIEEQESAEGDMIAERAVAMGLADAFAEAGGDNTPSARALNMDYATAVSGLEPPAVAVAFEEIALVRRELGLAKMSAVIPWVKDFLDGGEKLVLFAYHSDVVEGLIEAFKDYNPAYIYGKVPLPRRQDHVDKFQKDETCRLFVGNIHAAGVGHTLVRAWNVAFAEGDWTPALMEQCEDRVCRIGQTSDKIFSFHLVANGSLDARIAQSSKAKADNIEKAIG